MSSGFDPTEFIDGDFQAAKSSSSGLGAAPAQRAPTREEVDSRVAEAQQKLAELKRVQEDLERERASLEETRRRQREFSTGRHEVLQNLARGLVLLGEAELNTRREAEQMAKAIAGMREALAKVEVIQEEQWSRGNFEVELSRALGALENARMEWNSALLKFPILSNTGPRQAGNTDGGSSRAGAPLPLSGMSFGELCRLGLALTWPIASVILLTLAVLLVLLLQK